jgi:hypothetical protein
LWYSMNVRSSTRMRGRRRCGRHWPTGAAGRYSYRRRRAAIGSGDLWQRCIDDHDHEWHGWQLPTAANPYIAPSEIEAARLGLPERIFAQEFLAQFLDDAGGVFRRVMDAATATAQGGAIGGHEYAFGVDWGRTNDYTAMAVLDVTHSEIVALDRFNQIDYSLQLARLTALYERFRPRAIVAEANSMGQPLIEQLQAAGLPVVPFTTTAASKQIAVDALALAFERGSYAYHPRRDADKRIAGI